MQGSHFIASCSNNKHDKTIMTRTSFKFSLSPMQVVWLLAWVCGKSNSTWTAAPLRSPEGQAMPRTGAHRLRNRYSTCYRTLNCYFLSGLRTDSRQCCISQSCARSILNSYRHDCCSRQGCKWVKGSTMTHPVTRFKSIQLGDSWWSMVVIFLHCLRYWFTNRLLERIMKQ